MFGNVLKMSGNVLKCLEMFRNISEMENGDIFFDRSVEQRVDSRTLAFDISRVYKIGLHFLEFIFIYFLKIIPILDFLISTDYLLYYLRICNANDNFFQNFLHIRTIILISINFFK